MRLTHGLQLPIVVAVGDRLNEQCPHNARATGERMDEVGADKPRLGLLPLAHGPLAAHGLERVEEREVLLGGHLRLHMNETR